MKASFCGVFFAESLPNPDTVSQNYPKGQSSKRGKYYQQTPHNFNKSAVCSHRCPLRNQAPSLGHWCIGGYLRLFDPGLRNPTYNLVKSSINVNKLRSYNLAQLSATKNFFILLRYASTTINVRALLIFD